MGLRAVFVVGVEGIERPHSSLRLTYHLNCVGLHSDCGYGAPFLL